MWHRAGATGSLFGVSGRLPRSKTIRSLSGPVPEVLGKCGGALAGSMGGGSPTGERGAGCAPKLWHSQIQSPSAQKSERSHTRASFPAHAREVGSVEATLRTPAALARGVFSREINLNHHNSEKEVSRRQKRMTATTQDIQVQSPSVTQQQQKNIPCSTRELVREAILPYLGTR